MKKRYKKRRRESKIKNIILIHIENNIKEYVITSIIFLIGIVIGVIFINNSSESQSIEITNYIKSFVQDLKCNQNIDNFALLKDSLKKNCVLAVFLWFMGGTVIGTSIVYLIVCFRGFCLGYTISSVVLTLGFRKRIDFFNFKHVITKCFIYSVHFSTLRKWNKTP